MQEKIIKTLIQKGEELLNKPKNREGVDFFQDKDKVKKIVKTGIIKENEIKKANKFLNNLKKYPHAFVLACIMDSMIQAEKAWLIPYRFSKEIGGFEFSKLLSLNPKEIKEIFKKLGLRFWEKKSEYFHKSIQKIKDKYNGDASKIWKNNPTSCSVVREFLEFEGIGRKIATMAANILVRDFKIKMKDIYCIDVSPDRQVKKVLERTGFISENASDDELMYCTRELNPEYPGILDLPLWEIGRKWCRPKNPDCQNCYLNQYCPKKI